MPLDQALLIGFLFGAVSFYVQGRGYPYHRYPSEAFLLLLASRAFTQTLENPAQHTGRASLLQQSLAVTGILFCACIIVPRSLAQGLHFSWHQDWLGQTLEADLSRFGGAHLDHEVQCFDMAGGCIATLYQLHLVQATGFLYDCYLYPQRIEGTGNIQEQERYRQAFRRKLESYPPRLLIVTSDECGSPDYAYSKLDRWPWFSGWIADTYSLVVERRPTTPQRWGGKTSLPYGYRLYIKR